MSRAVRRGQPSAARSEQRAEIADHAERWPTWAPSAAIALLTAILITFLAPNAWLTLVLDGIPVIALLIAAGGIGWWPADWLLGRGRDGSHRTDIEDEAARNSEERRAKSEVRDREGEAPAEPHARKNPADSVESDLKIPLAVGIGLAVIGDLALLLGSFGFFSRWVAIGVLAVGIILALVRYARHSQAVNKPARRGESSPPRFSTGAGLTRIGCALPLVVPLAIAAIGATLPPGMLWSDEARAYDALEYHLEVPREYFEAGRIAYLPHNVYSNFPQQVEILYYFLMVLRGDVRMAAVSAQMLHAAFGVLSVLAVRAAVPNGGPRRVATILFSGTPWMAYLGVLAYVECGLLAYSSLALALVLPRLNSAETNMRVLVAAGACAGLAAGCKYTAVIIVAAALALGLLCCLRDRFAHRAWAVLAFSLAACATFSPWMIRNLAFTGNPVYPMAWSVLGGRDWSAEQNEQWERGHAVQGAEASVAGRASVAVRELVGRFDGENGFDPSLFGPLLVVGALVCGLILRDRRAAFLLLWISGAVAVWATTTQMPARFLAPLLAPLVCLWSLAASNGAGGVFPRGKVVLAAAVLSSVLGAGQLWRLWSAHDAYWKSASGTSLASFSGAADVFSESHPLNRIDAPNARFWLIGDAAVFHIARAMHYTVVFNRDPWIELVQQGKSPDELSAWLHGRGYTHLVFNWSEIARLRATYGFPNVVTPELAARLKGAGMTRVEHEGPRELEVLQIP